MDTVDTLATPAATTPSTSAAPAIQESPVSTQTSERPTSMRAALEQAAAPAATDASATTDGATTRPAETMPAAESAAPASKTGPIPYDVHKTALDNARTKAVTDYIEKTPAVKWASALPPETIHEWTRTAQRMTTDPVGFLRDYIAEVSQAHPQIAAQLKTESARLFGGETADAMPEPDVQIVDAQGRVAGMTYSADQLAKRDAFLERAMLAKVNQQIAPITRERDQRIATERAAETRKQVEANTDKVMARIDSILDGDTRWYAEVDKLMAADPTLDAHDAALQVRKTHIAPSVAEKARLAAIESQKKKAAGNTANGAGSTASPSRPRNAKELAAWMQQRERGA